MTPQPLYYPLDLTPAFALRYTWCGWTTAGDLRVLSEERWIELQKAWEKDNLRLLDRRIDGSEILLTFSTKPVVSPVFLAARAKGRLEHALRAADGKGVTFSRKVAVRSVGDNVTSDVQAYIASQVQNEEFIDPGFAEFLKQFSVVDSSIDLSIPAESRSGRYWYNLHLVLVTDGRTRIVDVGAIWRPGYYVGTFGEYNMRAIREAVRAESHSPARQAGRGLNVVDGDV